MTDFDPNHPVSLTKPLAPEPWPTPTPAQAPGNYLVPTSPNMAPPGPVPAAMPALYAPFQPAPVAYPTSTTTVVVQQSNVEIILAWIFTALTLLYMLPWAVAASRRSTNSVLIAVVTFFFAWTGIGWLVLLVLSFLGPTVYTVRATTTYVAIPPTPPAGMWAHCASDPPHVRRWWDGQAWTAHTTVG